MIEKTDVSFTASIYMAGDIAQAKQVCREFCLDVGLCVTVTPTTFIYTGGEEEGFIVGLINYPRFPALPQDITDKAQALAEFLRQRLFQHSYCIVGCGGGRTIWNSTRHGE